MLLLLTLLHATVDGVCGATLAAYDLAASDLNAVLRVFALYNLVAFGGQWLAGWLLDRKCAWLPHALVLALPCLGLGCLSALGMEARALLLGVGNCIFHVAAGSMVLRRYQTFSEPGIFVSSGAVGLALGLNGLVSAVSFLVLCLLATGLVLWQLGRLGWVWQGTADENSAAACAVHAADRAEGLAPGLCAVLLLGCVVLRGFGGGGGGASYTLIFPCVFALGKMLGGLCCDRLGYRKTVLLIFFLGCAALPWSGLLPLLLLTLAFNMTMPLTLRLLHWCRPGHPGLMFGLAAGCLLPGAFFQPVFSLPPQAMLVIQFLCLLTAGGLLVNTVGRERAAA